MRVALRKDTAPPVGSYVTFRARLGPPTPPVRPGGYDFARNLYFQGIGATGFVLGPITVAEPPQAAGIFLDLLAAFETLRDAIDQRIRDAVAGDRGAIASALITGKRDAISEEVRQVDVCVEPGPCAGDLRLSHGHGRGHRVLRVAAGCSR